MATLLGILDWVVCLVNPLTNMKGHIIYVTTCGSPKTMFIMGGGEGSAAREALKHKSMDRIVMCDIDQVN